MLININIQKIHNSIRNNYKNKLKKNKKKKLNWKKFKNTIFVI